MSSPSPSDPTSKTVFDGPTGGAAPPERVDAESPSAGELLDRYVVLETLGQGGMGVVLRAYDPRLRREVAVKRLRSRVLDDIGAERLVREAQAMAQLSHPNVVAVYDVVSAGSEVLLAMEMVEGRTMTAWLEERVPSREEILEAFVQAGRGLAAAHAADLIHRDFKPDNVLVGDDGRVRVTDFGLARPSRKGAVSEGPGASLTSGRVAAILDSHDSLRSSMTASGVVMGTPAYMAPEQHLGEEPDAKADQYAFCVSLWQALTGKRPFRGEYREVARAKVKGPPAWPRQATTPRRIVDAIVRGLDPSPSKRWGSMDELLAVLSRDTTRSGQRWIIAGALTVAVAGGAAGVAGWWARAPTVCTGARDHLAGVWDDERRAAVTRALRSTGVEYAETTSREVERRFDVYAEGWVAMHTEACEATSVRGEQSAAVLDLRMSCLRRRLDALDATAEVIAETEPGDVAVVEGAISLAAKLPSLDGCADVAALELALPPPEDPELAEAVAEARHEISRAHAAAGVGRDAEALAIVEAIPEQALAYEPLRAEVDTVRGLQMIDLRRYDEAAAAFTEAYERALRIDHRKIAVEAMSGLGFVLGARRMKEGEGEALVRVALAMAEQAGDQVVLGVVLNDYGGVLMAHARHERALEVFGRALEIQRESLGERHPRVLTTMTNMVSARLKLGELEEGLAQRRRILELTREIFGEEHPRVASVQYLIASLLHETGDYTAAADLFEEVLSRQIEILGDDAPEIALTRGELGIALNSLGRHAEAEAALRESVRVLEDTVGPDTRETLGMLNNLALVVEAQGRHEDALPIYRRAFEGVERFHGPDHPRVAQALSNVAGSLTNLRRYEEARPMLERAVEIQRRAEGDHPIIGVYMLNLGEALHGLGLYEEAERWFRESVPIIERGFGPEHVYVSYTVIGLGRTLLSQGERAEARPLLERGLALREQPGASELHRAEAAFLVARVLGDDERARARELALRAQKAYAEAGDEQARELAEVDAWLEAHPG